MFFSILALGRKKEKRNNLPEESGQLLREKALRKTIQEAYQKIAYRV